MGVISHLVELVCGAGHNAMQSRGALFFEEARSGAFLEERLLTIPKMKENWHPDHREPFGMLTSHSVDAESARLQLNW